MNMRGIFIGIVLSGLFIVLSAMGVPLAYANGIAVTNPSLTNQDTTNGTATVQFDIAWDNSWKNALNYDAAWVFVKYSTDNGSTWNHATMKGDGTNQTNPSGYSSGSGTVLDMILPSDKKGVFLQRPSASYDSGDIANTDVDIVWDWQADGLTAATSVKIKVFAIEMAYVPQGQFSLGSGGSETNTFYLSSPTTLYVISSEGAFNIGSPYFYYTNTNTYGGDQRGTGTPEVLPADFPKGFGGFYMMKYEMSQGQYRDFLNTLTSTQQANRCAATTNGNFMYSDNTKTTPTSRNGIQKTVSGYVCNLTQDNNASTSGEWIACNFLSWSDFAAYADWAGLRPMSELEFEKAARGTAIPVVNEYAWGSTALTQGLSVPANLVTAGTQSEKGNVTGNGLSNYGNDATGGPMRSGFAATGTTNRIAAGSSFYGIMDLSGNLWERVVTVGHSEGRAFTRTSHGNGALSANGYATNADWPGIAAGEVTGSNGSGLRGGAWNEASTTTLAVSDRTKGALADNNRDGSYGGRFVRTYP